MSDLTPTLEVLSLADVRKLASGEYRDCGDTPEQHFHRERPSVPWRRALGYVAWVVGGNGRVAFASREDANAFVQSQEPPDADVLWTNELWGPA